MVQAPVRIKTLFGELKEIAPGSYAWWQ